jgi:hypothetical protein
MDLLAFARILAPLAPVAGSIAGGLLGGPAGAVAGGKLVSLVMGKFGLPDTATPAQLSDRIAEAGEETSRARINAAMEQARAEIAGFVEIEKAYLHAVEVSLAQVGATMRAEIGHEHWFFNGWRPACGWVFVLQALVFGVMLCVAAARAAFLGDRAGLQTLTDAWPIFLAYFGTLAAMVGVYVIGRSSDKAKAIDAGTTATPAKPVPAVVTKPAAPIAVKARSPEIIHLT